MKKRYFSSFFISIFAVSAIAFGSFNYASAGFWDWFGLGSDSQQAQVVTTSYKWVSNGLVSESLGKYTGTCAKKQMISYTCGASNVGAKLYDGTNRGASYGDVGHAWPIYEGENTSIATEYTYSGCGLDKRFGGQVNQWECKASSTTTNSSSSSSLLTPTIQTKDSTSITSTSATLNGTYSPKGRISNVTGKESYVNFFYWKDESVFSGASQTPIYKVMIDYGVPLDTSSNISGLLPGTTYVFEAQYNYYDSAAGGFKVVRGGTKKFTTPGSVSNSNSSKSSSSSVGLIPTVQTGYADNITSNYASLFGTVDPKGKSVKVYFEIFPDPNGGSYGMMTPQQSLASPYFQSFGADVSNLKHGTTYKYYAVVTYFDSSTGTNKIIKDSIGKTFTTLSPSSSSTSTALPTVQTGSPTNITTNSVTLNGIVDPKDKTSKVYFQIFPDPNGGGYGMKTPQQSVSNSYGLQSFYANVSNLKPGTTYTYYAYVSYYDPITDMTKIIEGVGKTVTTAIGSSSSSSVSSPHAEWSLINTSAYGSVGVSGIASSSITGTITLKAKAVSGSMKKPLNNDFSVVFASSTKSNGAYSSANSISVNNLAITVTPSDSLVGAGGEYIVKITGNLYSSDPRLGSSQALFMAIKDIDSTVGGVKIINQTWGIDNFYTNPVQLTKEGSSSSSSVSGTLTVGTGGADYGSTDAFLYGAISNPNLENLFYYFNYRKESESSTQTKQTVGVNPERISYVHASSPISGLSPGAKYVYRLYAYSYTTGKTVSGELKSFITAPMQTSGSYIFTRELGYGSSGNDVTELQKRLTAEGFYSGPITGYYGSMTGEAVKKYQISNGIFATGTVGPQTLSSLNNPRVLTVSSQSQSSQSQETSISQLVELFITLGIISQDKADLARTSVKGM